MSVGCSVKTRTTSIAEEKRVACVIQNCFSRNSFSGPTQNFPSISVCIVAVEMAFNPDFILLSCLKMKVCRDARVSGGGDDSGDD